MKISNKRYIFFTTAISQLITPGNICFQLVTSTTVCLFSREVAKIDHDDFSYRPDRLPTDCSVFSSGVVITKKPAWNSPRCRFKRPPRSQRQQYMCRKQSCRHQPTAKSLAVGTDFVVNHAPPRVGITLPDYAKVKSRYIDMFWRQSFYFISSVNIGAFTFVKPCQRLFTFLCVNSLKRFNFHFPNWSLTCSSTNRDIMNVPVRVLKSSVCGKINQHIIQFDTIYGNQQTYRSGIEGIPGSHQLLAVLPGWWTAVCSRADFKFASQPT